MDVEGEEPMVAVPGDGVETVLVQPQSPRAVTPLPLAENLLLIAKDSVPEQAFTAHFSDAVTEASDLKLELQPPFAPFLIDRREEAATEALSNKEELDMAVEVLEEKDETLNVTDQTVAIEATEDFLARNEAIRNEVEDGEITEPGEAVGYEDTLVNVPDVIEGVMSQNGAPVPVEKALRVGAEILERTETITELGNGAPKFESLVEIYEREAVAEQGVNGTRGETSGTLVQSDIGSSVVNRKGTPAKHPANGYGDGSFKAPKIPATSGAVRDGPDSLHSRTPSGTSTPGHQRTPSGTSIVGDILYSIATGDEEGRNRQRILAFAAKRYANNVERNSKDHDALYNWALVLQESADSASPEVGSTGKDALLEEACKKYEAATRLCPSLHEAYYNWAIAISDRAKIRGRTKEAEDLWKQACDRYDQSVQLNWNSPQAFNNWGLALQELSAIVPVREKRPIVKKAIRKFRAAIQLRFDFHRAVYNLGTVLYGLAEDTLRSGRKLNSKETKPAELYSQSAVYIAAAHALKPDYPVYKGALRLVRTMIPLPYLKAGWLTIPPDGNSLAPHSSWEQLWFVLDHEALFEIQKIDRKALAQSYSKRSHMYSSEAHNASPAPRPPVLRIEMEELLFMAPCSDLSLPPGGGFRMDTASGPKYLIADTWDAMEAWVDSIRLVYTIYAQGKRDALAGVLVG